MRLIRLGRQWPESLGIRRLEQNLDRCVGSIADMCGQPGRRHEHEVGVVVFVGLDRLRVADDPEHVALPRTRLDGPRSAQDHVNVGAPHDRIVGAISRVCSNRVAEAA